MATLIEAARHIEAFSDGSLRKKLSFLEASVRGLDRQSAQSICESSNVNMTLLDSALMMKSVARQINEIIHSSGMLLLLSHILVEDEIVQYLSLGAGNTGKAFDLETNYQIAEFKFIQWKGGSETIRQNSLFKDYYYLAEADTLKRRCLYVIGDKFPLKFLNSSRALKSVMSKNQTLSEHFQKNYGTQYTKTSEYYQHWPQDRVQIIDVTQFIPNFATIFNIE
ncbi:MAG: hypothetical protein ABI690_02205 [Chloroflexota bacterium]